MITVLMIGSCAAVIASSMILLVSKKYDEGVLGHLGLAGMFLGCLVMLSDMVLAGVQYEVLPESLLLRVGVALFMVHLAWGHLQYCRNGRRGADQDMKASAPSCAQPMKRVG